MGSLDNLPIDEIFDDQDFAKVNGILTCYSYDPATGVFSTAFEHPIVKSSGLPAHATFVKPPENPQGTLIWNGIYWYDDLNYSKNMEIQKRIAEFNRYIEDNLHPGVVRSQECLLIKEKRGNLTKKEKGILKSLRERKSALEGYDPYDLTMPSPFSSNYL